MVVMCPNCGREIFSDPDSCVMCGWRRDAPQQPQRRDPRGAPPRGRSLPRRQPPPQRPPPRRYQDQGNERDFRRPEPRQNQYRQPQRGYEDRPRPQYQERERQYGGRQPQRREYQERQDRRGGYPPQQRREYQEGYDRREAYPQQQRRDPQAQYRRDPEGQYYQKRMAQEVPPRRYAEPRERRPPERSREGGGRNFCPNCGREIYGDPNSCVLCGWSMEAEDRRAPSYEPRRNDDYQGQRYQGEPQRRGPPSGWERQVENRVRGRTPPPREERKAWYAPESEGKSKKESVRDRFACENCGNPSLQFFADGLGRCPGCGQRFRYSTRPTSIRSKQKHKQFICSQCDSKNLQFFLDGRGVCPHCKREFRWKK